MEIKETFATAINCMDGRVQEPATFFMREQTGTAYIDAITGPGMVKKVVNAAAGDKVELDRIRTALYVSLHKHKIEGVGVFAHQHCAGNPVSDEQQIKELRIAAETLRKLVEEDNSHIPVWGAFISKTTSGVWVAEQKVELT